MVKRPGTWSSERFGGNETYNQGEPMDFASSIGVTGYFKRPVGWREVSRGERIRTADLLVPSQAR